MKIAANVKFKKWSNPHQKMKMTVLQSMAETAHFDCNK